MIYVNEKKERDNLWALAKNCKVKYAKHISGAQQPNTDDEFMVWGLTLACDFKKMRNSRLYAADFSSNESGYQHFADALAGCEGDPQEKLPEILDGELKKPCKQSTSGQNEPTFPFLYKELLKEVKSNNDNDNEASDMPDEDTKKIQQAYARLLCLNYVKKYMDAGYRVCRVFDKNRKKLDAYFEQKSNSASEEGNNKLIEDPANELRKLFDDFRSSAPKNSDDNENRKNQKFDIYDRQISYLERIARAFDKKSNRVGDGSSIEEQSDCAADGIFIPSDMRKLEPESILLANLIYREIKVRNNNEYSSDYWIIPGLYQSILGIYGDHAIAPDNFFKRVLKDREVQGASKHPIESMIVVSEHYMVKLSKEAWKSLAAVEKLYKDNDPSVFKIEAVFAPQEDGASDGKAGDVINNSPTLTAETEPAPHKDDPSTLWNEYKKSEETSSKTDWKDIGDTTPCYIEDNGGTEAYHKICELHNEYKARQQEEAQNQQEKIKSNNQLIRDIFERDSTASDLSSAGQAVSEFLSRKETQDNITKITEEKPLSLLSNNKSWDKLSLKLILGYYCWANVKEDDHGNRYCGKDLSEIGANINITKDNLKTFRSEIQDKEYTLSASTNEENKVDIVLKRRSMQASSLSSWLFGNGEKPEKEKRTEELEDFKNDAHIAVLRFVDSGSGIEAGKRSAFSRKPTERVDELDLLLRLLICYALHVSNADHIILCPQDDGNASLAYIKGGEGKTEYKSFDEICDAIARDTAPFGKFIDSFDPREEDKEPTFRLSLTVERLEVDSTDTKKNKKYNDYKEEFDGYFKGNTDPAGKTLYKCRITEKLIGSDDKGTQSVDLTN